MLINTSASSEVAMTPFAGTVPSHAGRSAAAFPAAGRGVSGGRTVTGADRRWALEGQFGGRGDCQAREIQPDGFAAAPPATVPGSGPVVTGQQRRSAGGPAVGYAGTSYARTGTSKNASYQNTSNHNSTNLMTRLIPAARGGWGSLPGREPGPA